MQIRQVVSESLQSTVRRLLPSQQGFTEDLQATNVIQPIIDLTPSAEGSNVPVQLQEAMSFGGVSSYTQSGSGSTVIVNSTGFWRIQAQTAAESSSTQQVATIVMTDGLSTKVLWSQEDDPGGNQKLFTTSEPLLTVFVRAGESISITATANTQIQAQVWQIADVNGVLVNPVGFTPQ